MPIITNDTLQNNSPKALDAKHGKLSSGVWQPYASVAEANSLVPQVYRHKGLTVIITENGLPTEYWWREGIITVSPLCL